MAHRLLLAGIIATTVAVAGLALAQQQQQIKQAQNAVITAQTMDYDWVNNTVDFTGNTRVVLKGEYDATMTSPSLAVKLSPKGDRVLTMEAAGPVNFTVTTKPDANGLRRKIVGTAKERATYDDATQVVKLLGGASADLLPIEPGAAPAEGTEAPQGLARAEAIHFTGQTITANLKTSKMTVDDANLQVETKAQ
jgi:lipopolysaccharide export system protein LptA